MQQFLDACWLYGDKEVISRIYMCPIVMSTTYGEREGKLTLATAWEILGGRPCSGICGQYVCVCVHYQHHGAQIFYYCFHFCITCIGHLFGKRENYI